MIAIEIALPVRCTYNRRRVKLQLLHRFRILGFVASGVADPTEVVELLFGVTAHILLVVCYCKYVRPVRGLRINISALEMCYRGFYFNFEKR